MASVIIERLHSAYLMREAIRAHQRLIKAEMASVIILERLYSAYVCASR
jgi:hypothetical protein